MERNNIFQIKNFERFAADYIDGFKKVLDSIDINGLGMVMQILETAYTSNKTIYLLGNGGSASTSNHFATDLGKGTAFNNKKRFKVISLSANVSLLTAYANDNGYENVFIEQLKNLLVKDDVIIAFSASGNSVNVVRAVEYANSIGAMTISFVGFSGGELKKISKYLVHVNDNDYGHIEDTHSTIQHILSIYFRNAINHNS